jgi:Fe(3+) dicitrate transport protein
MREEAAQGPYPPELTTDSSLVFEAGARVYLVPRAHLYLHLRNVANAHDIASRRPYGARPIAPRWVQAGIKATF